MSKKKYRNRPEGLPKNTVFESASGRTCVITFKLRPGTLRIAVGLLWAGIESQEDIEEANRFVEFYLKDKLGDVRMAGYHVPEGNRDQRVTAQRQALEYFLRTGHTPPGSVTPE